MPRRTPRVNAPLSIELESLEVCRGFLCLDDEDLNTEIANYLYEQEQAA